MFSVLSMKSAESFSVLSSHRHQDVFLHSFWVASQDVYDAIAFMHAARRLCRQQMMWRLWSIFSQKEFFFTLGSIMVRKADKNSIWYKILSTKTPLCLFVYYMNIKDFSYSRLCNNLQGANGPSDIRGRWYLICEYQLCTLYRRKSRLSDTLGANSPVQTNIFPVYYIYVCRLSVLYVYSYACSKLFSLSLSFCLLRFYGPCCLK